MRPLILAVLPVLAGCATSEQVTGPHGAPAYLVTCGNAVKAKCIEKAATLCPNGYTELERQANRYDGLAKVGNVGVPELKADTTTRMLIQCR